MAKFADPSVPPATPPPAEPRFRPQVGPPVPRMRPAFALALVASAAFALGVITWDRWTHPSPPAPAEPMTLALPRNCTPLEVEEVLRSASLTDVERATCLAVAGKIDRARELLLAMNDEMRSQAIAQLFSVAHPIADRGDDASAGPIMALVVELWPDNYMAVFHAGMAEFALGHDGPAGQQLARFLTMYASHDVWRARAEQALAAIAAHTALDQRRAHVPPE